MRSIWVLWIALLFSNCGGVKILSTEERKALYRPEFYERIELIRRDFVSGNIDRALSNLKAVDDAELESAEKALKHNLIGVIFFSQSQFGKSINQFKEAAGYDTPDVVLRNQIYLNMASSHYKLKMFHEAVSALNFVKQDFLQNEDLKKFHRLSFVLYSELKERGSAVRSLIGYLADIEDFAKLKQEVLLEKLSQEYFKMPVEEQMRVLEEKYSSKSLVVGYLGYLQAERLYYSGQRDASRDITKWLKDQFADNTDIKQLVDNFSYRMESFAKINPQAIGVVLPFSAPKKKEFAQRAMKGIDSIFQKLTSLRPKGTRPKLYLRDNKGSGLVGASSVRDLVEKHYVSVIIGGLFSGEAAEEYLEAKKYGVIYISLSQVFLPRDNKNHLLIEMPGSVESLIDQLFSNKMLSHFGQRAAILYPDNDRGKAYVDEFWRQAKINLLKISSVQSFDPKATDFRGPVKKLLGLNFPRERAEELELLAQIHDLQKRGSIRRIQTLPPQVDFDWIFVPAYPKQALQLIPSFSYYDAFNINFIGGPSWRSSALVKRSRKLGALHFLGDDLGEDQSQFREEFYAQFKEHPKLIEMFAHDAMKISLDLMTSSQFSTREELEMLLLKRNQFQGLTGHWNFNQGVWLKAMTPLKLHRGSVDKLFSETMPAPVEEPAQAI